MTFGLCPTDKVFQTSLIYQGLADEESTDRLRLEDAWDQVSWTLTSDPDTALQYTESIPWAGF